MHLKIEEILRSTDGELLNESRESYLKVEINSITINSRDVKSNALFIPLHGEKINSHQYIDNAFENGAIATLTDEKIKDLNKDKIYIKVKDTKKALQDLAAFYRRKFKIKMVGITGSVGKTSTKEMVSLVLSSKFNVHKTSGNLNGQIGLPLTIFELQQFNDFAVIEMGISEFSEMEKLADIVNPDFAIMTNIGVTHIENLKSQENILNEKLKITKNFNSDSVLFINKDDKMLAKVKSENKFKIVTFGIESDCDFKAENVKFGVNQTSFILKYKDEKTEKEAGITIPAIGIHNVYNALAGIALGVNLGISILSIQKSILKYKSLDKRQCIFENVKVKNNGSRALTINVIDDTYNANPDSMINAINVLNIYCKGKNGRKVAVLGDMLELGEVSKELHLKLGEYAAKNKLDMLLTIGEEAKNIALGAEKVNKDIKTQSFENNIEAYKFLKSHLQNGDNIIFKGSRGMHIDEIVSKFVD